MPLPDDVAHELIRELQMARASLHGATASTDKLSGDVQRLHDRLDKHGKSLRSTKVFVTVAVLVFSTLTWRIGSVTTCVQDRSKVLASPSYQWISSFDHLLHILKDRKDPKHGFNRTITDLDTYLTTFNAHPPNCSLLPWKG